MPGQHKSIVLVYVSDATLDRLPYVSPIDRKLLAELIQAIDQAGAKLIGLDIILDHHTEAIKDELLRQAFRHTNAKMVLGIVDEPESSGFQKDFFLADVGGTKPETGYIYFDEHHNSMVISDHVVRFIAEKPEGDGKSFAEALALAAGSSFKPQSRYIAWLLRPTNRAETFMTLAAEDVLGRGKVSLPVADLLRDKIVLIGGNFDDRDQHLTPLSVSRDDFYPGLFIHAQILAQLLARRSIIELPFSVQLLLALSAIFPGYWLGRRSGHYYLWLELCSVATLLLIGFLAFLVFSVIFPYALVLIAWLGGAAAGHYGRTQNHDAVPEIK
jgi:adenylate cyclase